MLELIFMEYFQIKIAKSKLFHFLKLFQQDVCKTLCLLKCFFVTDVLYK